MQYWPRKWHLNERHEFQSVHLCSSKIMPECLLDPISSVPKDMWPPYSPDTNPIDLTFWCTWSPRSVQSANPISMPTRPQSMSTGTACPWCPSARGTCPSGSGWWPSSIPMVDILMTKDSQGTK